MEALNFSPSEVCTYYGVRVPQLRQTGKEWRGPCPVHQGRNNNFAVDPRNGMACCHSQCGHGWDILGLEQAITGNNFKEALGEVNRIVGRDNGPGNRSRSRIVAEYSYRDEEGRILFQCVRLEPKGFFQRRPNGHDGWIKNLEGVRLVPYRLPKLLATDTVFICEGEKDVHTVESLGRVATCNPMGAGKWRDEYARYFKGKEVFILP